MADERLGSAGPQDRPAPAALEDALVALDEVLITDQLVTRPARPPDYEAQASALSSLARELANSSSTVLQRLTDLIVETNLAGSAGISILGSENHKKSFHWAALSGLWAEHLGGLMPFDASPCGVVVTRNSPLLFSRPHAHFPAAHVEPLIHEILLVPFHVQDEPVGTLWVIAHDQERAFDSEDLRLLTTLTGFASAGYQIAAAIDEAQAAQQELEQRVAERTSALTEANAALRGSEEALAIDLANAELLRSLSAHLVTEENAETIYGEILSAALVVAAADAGTIQIFNPQTKSLALLASKNFTHTVTNYYDQVDASSRTACGVALRTGARAFVDFPDEIEDSGCRLLVGEGLQSALALPLVSRSGMPLGMLNAHWREARHRPHEKQLRFLDLLARQAADLIEQRQAQSALRESEARQRALVEGVPQLVWRAADGGRWTWASPQWTAYTGQSEVESRGWGWLDPVHPDDREAARAAWRHAVETGTFEVDYRLSHASQQRYRWFQTRATPVRNEAGEIVEWLGTSTDVDDLRTLQVRQEVLVNELQHRARNLLGVITSVAGRTLKQGGSVEAFEERLQALSRAQGLLSQAGSDTVDVGELVSAELAAHADGTSDHVTIAGPKVRLTARQVQNFALALHELTTNAMKYGALRNGTGQLSVSWEIVLDRRERSRLALSWIESGVVIKPEKVTRRGYGTELIQEALAYALEAVVEYELGRDGVRCRIEMPVS